MAVSLSEKLGIAMLPGEVLVVGPEVEQVIVGTLKVLLVEVDDGVELELVAVAADLSDLNVLVSAKYLRISLIHSLLVKPSDCPWKTTD